MRKCLAIVLITLFVLTTCILTLPLPTKFEYTFYGAKVTETGTVLTDGMIVLTGTQYNYLFKNARITLDSVSVPGLDIPKQKVETYIYNRVTKTYDYIPSMIFLKELDSFAQFNLGLDFNREWCVIKIDNWYFVGSIHEDFDAASLLTNCEAIVN